MTIAEMSNFMKACGHGWNKELKNYANFDRTLSKQISDFPYSKVFSILKENKYQLILRSDEPEVTLKTFSEDVQLQFEKLSYALMYKPELKEMPLDKAFFNITHVNRGWGEVELNLYSNRGKIYWLFCKRYLFYAVKPKKVICCQNKQDLNLFLDNINEGIKYHGILDSEEIE